ncbi:MAG: ribonuclease R [Idiomarina sp.]|nr:ribonuclease R [Idiomarina sp.]
MSSESQTPPPHYDVEIPSREELLESIKKDMKPVAFSSLVELYKLDDERQQVGLKRRLRAMERDGQLVYTRADSYGLPERMDLKRGRVIGHRDGFGFVQLESGGQDLFLPHHQMQLTMHGDTVLVKEGSADAKGRREARLVRVINEGRQEIVGRYFFDQGIAVVVPDDSRLTQDLIISPEHSNGARHGQMVVAEIIHRPSRRSSPVGKVLEVLGEHMAPGMEIEVAIREHGIPQEWSDQVAREVSKIADEVTDEDKRGRVDLRDLPLLTIDGEDARDFDDAVYCQPDGQGFRLWVAIADVSHYVRPGTALDKEATERGNSVYFPSHVIPMLPEKLSNGLCSLNPHVDRLCMVAEMTIGARGKLMGFEFYPAVMRSHARLTYTKVAAILEGEPGLRKEYDAVVPHIENLQRLYKVLRQTREQRGAIDFDTVETRFIFNAQRKIEQIVPVRRNQAHMLIEECMIMANVAAARFVEKHEAKALFRIHDKPDDERLQGFRLLLGELGISMPGGGEPSPSDFSEVLRQVAERPDRELIQMMLLRSLQQAVYSAENRGHFGLALEAYGHFTSPIRRYPDLILHRVIKHVVAQRHPHMPGLEGQVFYSDEQLAGLGPHCSSTERRADDATRQVDEWLKCEYMQDHVNDEFPGVIASVTNFGLFVRLDELMIDGLIHISNLPSQYYHFDPDRHTLIGETTRQAYRIGDKVVVKVQAVNLDERKIDFRLISVESSNTELPARIHAKPAMKKKSKAAPKSARGEKGRVKSSTKGKRGKPSAKRGKTKKR